ncbi:MAG: hypothetical protein WCC57_17055 [Paracoccaceae bacterium]
MGEMWGLLFLAAIVGLIAGWIIWGRRSEAAGGVDADEASRLRAALADCQSKGQAQAGRVSALEQELAAAESRARQAAADVAGAENRAADARADAARAEAAREAAAKHTSMIVAPVMAVPATVTPKTKAVVVATPKTTSKAAPKTETVTATKPAAKAAAKKAVEVVPGAPVKPATLKAARGGKADDLKLIKGVGPKLAALCNKLGFWHFDQIAAWTEAEIAWVDENLEGFKGRVVRDEWVVQARDLAAGKPPRAGGEN